MPRNVYFSQSVASEQSVYEDLIIESLKIYGQDVYYIPRSLINKDNLLGEDQGSSFDDAYMIEAYIENPEGFDGSGDLYQKFGLEIRDEVTFVIARKQWAGLVGVWNNDIDNIRPMEGDLIFLPMTNKFFEISFVEHEQPFYQLSNLPVYKLNCSLFEYNDEALNTGVDTIDDLAIQTSYQLPLDIRVTNAQHFEQGEIVTQAISVDPAISVYGTVQTITKYSDISGQIGVSNIGVTGSTEAKSFIVSDTLGLTGSRSGNICFITSVDDITDDTTFANDGAASNTIFEIEADGFLDFTESNPFGDPSETY
jgi:hypothetical protein